MSGKQGYKRLVVWQNALKLRKRVYEVTKAFPKSEMRRVSQMRDAARSIKQNIQEGYYRLSLGEYIYSLNVSKGSLGELMGDIEDCYEDGLITEDIFKELDELSGKTDYLLMRLMQSLRKKKETTEGNQG